ncbi:MAG TPA: FtsX-like permease family protein [Ktedonobacterales bacterium]|nr:FtsX-like permease family protein [Ktedonobacterales bacterium]
MKSPITSSAHAADEPRAFGTLSRGSLPARSGTPSAAIWLALQRARGGWRFLLTVAVDLLLVAALLCAIPLCTTLLAAIELQSQLAALPVGGRNIDVTITHTHLPTTLQSQEERIVTTQGRALLGSFAPHAPTNILASSPVLMSSRAGAPPENYTELQFEAYQNSQLLPHIRLLAGAPLPTAETLSAAPAALITEQMAQVDNVRVGDLVTVTHLSQFEVTTLTVRVAGIWAPTNPSDPFWNGATFLSLPLHDTDPFIFPVLLSPTVLAPALNSLQPIIVQHWIFTTDPQAIKPAQASAISSDLTRFRTGLATSLGSKSYVVGIQTITGLDKALGAVSQLQRQFALSVESTGVLALGVALLLLALVVHSFVDRDRAVIAILRSRGASVGQMLGVYVSLTMLVSALAALLGAALAVWLTPPLVERYLEPSAAVSGAYLARQIDPGQLALSVVACVAVAGGVSWWVTLRALRTDPHALALSAATGGSEPFWRRMYLDVVLAALCVVGYVELTSYGDAVNAAQSGPSPLLVATPLLLLTAGSLLLLRLFPLVAALMARIAARGRGALSWLIMGSLSRGGAQTSIQALLPMLVVAVLALAITYDTTVRQTATAQAAYQVGADIRLTERTSETAGSDARIRAQLAGAPGAPGVTSVYRGTLHTAAYWDVLGNSRDSVDALAIDPHTWAGVSAADAWRPSFASAPLSTLMAEMAAHEPSSADTQAQVGAQDDPVWVIVSSGFAQAQGLTIGKEFRLVLPDSVSQYSFFVVGAIVNDFPTLYPARSPGGFIIADERTLFAAMAAQSGGSTTAIGPNEYWLRSGDAATLAAVERQQDALDASALLVRQTVEAGILGAPTLSGMRALLIFSAIAISLLALLAAALQTALSAHQRRPQLMSLRAIGVSRAQVAIMLLGERLFTVIFGAVGGGLTGWALSGAILPYLQIGAGADAFSAAPTLTTNPALLALSVGALAGLLLLDSVVVSVRTARAAINLRLLSVEN